MKKRIIAIFTLAVLVLSLFAACAGNTPDLLTDEEAQQIALKDAGLTAASVTDLHTHFAIANNIPQFQIHFTYGSTEYEYVINGATGEIISSNK